MILTIIIMIGVKDDDITECYWAEAAHSFVAGNSSQHVNIHFVEGVNDPILTLHAVRRCTPMCSVLTENVKKLL